MDASVRKRVIGITGGIATGKSAVLHIFADLGAATSSADDVSRRLMSPGTEIYQQVIARFGRRILMDDGRIDRHALAEIVFADEAARRDLNELTHPAIIAEIAREIGAFREDKGGPRMMAVEIPLLFECGMEASVDTTVVVTSEQEVQLHRLTRRDLLPREEAFSRLRSQMSLAEKAALADYIIENNGSPAELRAKVAEVFRKNSLL